MLEAYPTKKWFVVLGDDNYVLLDNYVNVLSAFDPEQPWALSRMVHRNKFGCKVDYSLRRYTRYLFEKFEICFFSAGFSGQSRKLDGNGAYVRLSCGDSASTRPACS